MKIDDFLPKRVVNSLLIVAVLIAISIYANHKFGDRYQEWLEDVRSGEKEGKNRRSKSENNSGARSGFTNNRVNAEVSEPEVVIEQLEASDIERLEYIQTLWREERGYFSQEDYEQYATYDDETLERLGDQGDLLALDIIADGYDSEGRIEKAANVRWKAVVYGSTAALNDLVAMNEAQLLKEEDVDRKEIVKSMLIHAEVSAIRGDNYSIWTSLMSLNRSGIELSEKEKNDISSRAKSIYSKVEDRRRSMGLGSFINDSDPLTDIQMDYMISKLPNINRWASSYVGHQQDQRR